MLRPQNNTDMPFQRNFGGQYGFHGAFGSGRGRERLMRGRLNMIILETIKERPRHGYDVIKAIEEKFYGFYAPSAGSVYPILQELEDQGFVASSQESGKKIYSIAKDGENELKKNEEKLSDMREHLRERLADMGRFRDLTDEMKQTTHFMFSKLCEYGAPDAGTMKKLRMAMVSFKSEVEEILREQKQKSL